MAIDIYPDFRSCLFDFKEMEGDNNFDLLKKEMSILKKMNIFPNLTNIESFYGTPFWSNFGMMATEEDLFENYDLLEL